MDKLEFNQKQEKQETSTVSVPALDKSKVVVEGFEYPTFSKVDFLTPYRRYARVTDELLRRLYLRTARIRECVDGIAREIASREIVLEIESDTISDLDYKALKNFADKFLGKVNRKGDTLRSLIEKAVRDLLVHSRFCIEKVRNAKGEVVELYARDPAYIVLEKDEHGVVEKFIQNIEGKRVDFDPDDIIFGVFNPCSFDDYGIPIIEGILDEVASLILGTRTIAYFIFDDAIPPGVLVLGELGEEAYNRLKEMFTNPQERNKMKVIRNIDPNLVKWVRLDRSISSETKLDYLLDRLDNIIFRAFQVPTGKESTSRGGAEFIDKLSQSKLILPLVTLIEDKLTYDLFKFEYGLPVRLKLLKNIIGSQEFYDYARGLALLVNNGVITYNEARKLISLPQLKIGNVRIGKLGNEYVIFDENTGLPKRLPEFIGL